MQDYPAGVKLVNGGRVLTVERDDGMYHITLTQEQYAALRDLLQCSIPELHSEIIHTDTHCLRETLKERRQSLVSLPV